MVIVLSVDVQYDGRLLPDINTVEITAVCDKHWGIQQKSYVEFCTNNRSTRLNVSTQFRQTISDWLIGF